MASSNDSHIDMWPALYAAGATLREISERSGFTRKRVRQELLAHGVAIRPQSRRGTRNRTSAWHETAAKLRGSGVSVVEIGRQFGKTEQAVRMALRRLAAKAPTQPRPIDSPLAYPPSPRDCYEQEARQVSDR